MPQMFDLAKQFHVICTLRRSGLARTQAENTRAASFTNLSQPWWSSVTAPTVVRISATALAFSVPPVRRARAQACSSLR
eukprot:1060966-Pleurochrysis_carterae.AAC.1